MASSRTIVIIGAGIAGLSTACHLLKHVSGKRPLNITILERLDRPGGRILSVALDTQTEVDKANSNRSPTSSKCTACTVELGATWIHGKRGNILYQYALDRKLVEEDGDGDEILKRSRSTRMETEKQHEGFSDYIAACAAIYEGGEEVDSELLKEAYELYSTNRKLAQNVFSTKTVVAAHSGLESVGAFMDMQFQNHPKYQEMRPILSALTTLECSISGCDSLYDVRLDTFGEYDEMDGANTRIPTGFSSLVDHIMRSQIADGMIRYKKTVTHIDARGDGQLSVHCADGNIFRADYVVCTTSLGVLKESADSLFAPSLPADKLEAIRRMGFGTVNKIFVQFQKPILPEDQKYIFLMRRTPNPVSSAQDWTSAIYQIDQESACAQHSNVYTYCFWLSGPGARAMETESDEEINHKICKALKSFGLREQSRDHEDAQIINTLRSRWCSNAAFRGSYSFVATSSNRKDIETLSQPIFNSRGKPVILFAGEATHPTCYSTAHGAYLSGTREAQRILECIKE